MDFRLAFIIFLYINALCLSCHSKSGQISELPDDGLVKGRVIRILDGDTFDMPMYLTIKEFNSEIKKLIEK